MKVGEVRDAQPVELGRHSVEPHVEDALAEPSRLEPRPCRDRRCRGAEDKENPGQTESFSVTGSTETTWRLNFSSERVEPGRDADELREMQDRHLEVLAGLLAAASTATRRARGGRAGTA